MRKAKRGAAVNLEGCHVSGIHLLNKTKTKIMLQ
jgi:hypothetical protein